jgi:hypothetical protein
MGAGLDRGETFPDPEGEEPRRALLDRIVASPAFSRSPRLKQVLQYLGERGLTESGKPLTEERIGVELFGRKPGYDTASDTIVRVQVSQLRKKLEHYFVSDGAEEPLIIELPKRSYAPVFRPREQATAERQTAGKGLAGWRVLGLSAGLLLAVCAGAAGWLALENSRLRERLSMGIGQAPFRDHFWTQLFRGGRQTQLIASDGNAMVFCDFLGRTLTPAEYIGGNYPASLIDSQVHDSRSREAVRSLMDNYLTNMTDLRAAARLAVVAAATGGRLNIVYARDFRYHPQDSDNLILLSHRKANPWAGLFEERLNFRYEFDAKAYRASILNHAPKPGEQVKYPVQWGVETYALIAYQRKPVGEGHVLLLEGTDVGAVEAGCDLLTDESRIRSVYGRLGIRPSGPVPEFEVLLRAKQLRSWVRDYTIVAHRLISR